MQSAIVQKATGEKLHDYLGPRLFAPLGIEGATWEESPEEMSVGGFGLSVRTGDIATFGQMLLQKGTWEGRQIVPAAWVEEATSRQVANGSNPDSDWDQGYGYQFWRCQGTAFRSDGAFGQFTIVLPEQDAVIVMTSENKNMQGQLDLVWKHLLPAFGETPPAPKFGESDFTPAFPGDPILELQQRLKDLKLSPPSGSKTSPLAKNRRYKLTGNDLGLAEVGFEFAADTCTFFADAHRITGGLSRWNRTQAAMPGTPPRLISGGKPKTGTASKIAASATWTDERTLVLTLRYYETPHSDTLTCQFDDDKVTISFLSSITAMNPKAKDARAPLKGQAI
jgi:hypothetical protein